MEDINENNNIVLDGTCYRIGGLTAMDRAFYQVQGFSDLQHKRQFLSKNSLQKPDKFREQFFPNHQKNQCCQRQSYSGFR